MKAHFKCVKIMQQMPRCFCWNPTSPCMLCTFSAQLSYPPGKKTLHLHGFYFIETPAIVSSEQFIEESAVENL